MDIKQHITRYIPQPVKNKLKSGRDRLKAAKESFLQPQKPVQPLVHPDSAFHENMRAISQKYGADYLNIKLREGWTNPGHMFDEMGEIFRRNKRLVLAGDASRLNTLRKRLDFLSDEPESIVFENPCEEDIEWMRRHTLEGSTVVLAYEDPAAAQRVMASMIAAPSHILNVNVFHDWDFIGDLIPKSDLFMGIFAFYASGKVYLNHNNILTTTRCNLNCEYCLNYNPYIKEHLYSDLDSLKKSIDTYFAHVDRVDLLQFTGGEPMLYRELLDALKYVKHNYHDKVHTLCFVTNGIITPNSEFLEFCKKHDIFIFLDNYTKQVPQIEEKFRRTQEVLKEYGIRHVIPNVTFFVKSFPPKRENLQIDNEGLKKKYASCHIGVQNYRDGRMASCTYHAFAVNADLVDDSEENWLDLSRLGNSDTDKKKLIEFRFGFNQKGFTDWCRYCNGHVTINHIQAPPAVQAKGKLHWDKANPTFLED